jgi:hypothetical protein
MKERERNEKEGTVLTSLRWGCCSVSFMTLIQVLSTTGGEQQRLHAFTAVLHECMITKKKDLKRKRLYQAQRPEEREGSDGDYRYCLVVFLALFLFANLFLLNFFLKKWYCLFLAFSFLPTFSFNFFFNEMVGLDVLAFYAVKYSKGNAFVLLITMSSICLCCSGVLPGASAVSSYIII